MPIGQTIAGSFGEPWVVRRVVAEILSRELQSGTGMGYVLQCVAVNQHGDFYTLFWRHVADLAEVCLVLPRRPQRRRDRRRRVS